MFELLFIIFFVIPALFAIPILIGWFLVAVLIAIIQAIYNSIKAKRNSSYVPEKKRIRFFPWQKVDKYPEGW